MTGDALEQIEREGTPARRGEMTRGDLQPIGAGAVAGVVGFASTFTVVLAGLRGVGADPRQAASGLLAVCLAMGVVAIVLGLRFRMPISIAWSTPGAALLVSAGDVHGGYPAALGAFAVGGGLMALSGRWTALGRWIAAIPVPLASALLAGVLLPVCLTPVRAAVELPLLAGPAIVAWALLTRFARPYAVPGALLVAAIAVVIDGPLDSGAATPGLLPHPVLTVPHLDALAILAVGLPLFVVTMASQNVPGMSVMAGFGYRPPLRPILTATGAATALAAPFGGHAVNLAAITAALQAGPDAHPDPGRRWIASVSGGITNMLLGLGAGLATALAAAAPPLLVEAVAGLALLPTLGASLAAATADPERREAATVTLVVGASAITAAGISAAFWGLLAGLAILALRGGPNRSIIRAGGPGPG